MTAAVGPIQGTQERWTRKQLPLAGSVIAYKNTIAVAKPSIKAVTPAATGAGETNDFMLGVFVDTVDNSATSTLGLVEVDFLFERTILWCANDGSITKANNLFGDAYAADNQTVSATSTNRAAIGRIVDVDPVLGVAVMIAPVVP